MNRISRIARFILVLTGLCTCAGAASAMTPSQRIDQLVETRLKELGIEPNPPTDDARFVRRAYLDIVGRIPALEETRRFLDSERPGKRGILIDLLLESEGHVSHGFNLWADILRAKSGGRDVSGEAYVGWIKDSLRENRSYRDFVTDLVTAEGQAWENPAVGFYLRDRGMPLDHMAYTSQIFLGKAMVCAQCHDHPFDEISQMEFYQMAAFTHGVSTSLRPQSVLGLDKSLGKRRARGDNRHLDRAAQTLLAPIAAGVTDTDRSLALPHDYQYDDADPGEVVRPETLFGDRASRSRGKNLRRAYAEWMTDPENDRFTVVIANRLWHRVMGRGLIEPIDDIKDTSTASHPELLDFLVREMKRIDYDQRGFLAMLYKTRTYQRQTGGTYAPPGEDYHFPGPILRRMSAEQLWDSLLTLTIPDPDNRKVATGNARRLAAEREKAKVIVESQKGELVSAIAGLAEIHAALDDDTADLRGQLTEAIEAKDQERINALRHEIRVFERASRAEQDRYVAAFFGGESAGGKQDPLTMMRMNSERMQDQQATMTGARQPTAERETSGEPDPWKGFAPELVRASELPSPTPAGHFLRQFGQSDREVIDNASNETSSDQALTLMNGEVFARITDSRAVLSGNIAAAATPPEKLDTVFLSMLGRPATEKEIRRMDPIIEASGDLAYQDLIWALLNTSEFSFIQ